jgi:hypothetical protein
MRLSNLLAVLVVLALVCTAGSAFAGIGEPEVPGAYELSADTMIFSYYDIRTSAQGGPGLSDNYFAITNVDSDEFYQVHVRVRTGQCSVELLDFDVLLTPRDVFTFDLYQDADGDTVFASCDTHTLTASQFAVDSNGCFILDSGTFPNMLSLIQTCGNCPDGSGAPLSASSALEATRWGYVEVIGEAMLCPSNSSNCGGNDATATECTIAQLEAGDYNAWTFYQDYIYTSGDDCSVDASVSGNDVDLFGRVYYAAFDAGRNLTQLATANAFKGDQVSGGYDDTHMVIHRPCYSDNSPGCNPGDGELENSNPTVLNQARYAYDIARTTVGSSQGATDINYCFYKDTITTADDVDNCVGAGATFGPTQVDLHRGSYGRDGSCSDAVSIIAGLNELYGERKRLPFSNYFYIPGQGQTRLVFTFPLQHYINQEIEIEKQVRFDTEENECTLPSQKFISPGLPAPGILAGEVSILTAHDANDGCDYNEGWLGYYVNVVDDGPGATDGDTPALYGLIVHWGDNSSADVFDVTPMQFWWD